MQRFLICIRKTAAGKDSQIKCGTIRPEPTIERTGTPRDAVVCCDAVGAEVISIGKNLSTTGQTASDLRQRAKACVQLAQLVQRFITDFPDVAYAVPFRLKPERVLSSWFPP